METPAGGDVDVEIGVMHAVHSPQHRHFVEQDMLRVDDEIEHEEADERSHRKPQSGKMEEPPAASGGEQGGAHHGGRNEDAHRGDIDQQDAEIARPARLAADGENAARRRDLPNAMATKMSAKADTRIRNSAVRNSTAMDGTHQSGGRRWTASPLIARVALKNQPIGSAAQPQSRHLASIQSAERPNQKQNRDRHAGQPSTCTALPSPSVPSAGQRVTEPWFRRPPSLSPSSP